MSVASTAFFALRRLLMVAGLLAGLSLGGCALLPGSDAVRSPGDPFERYNRAMFDVNQQIDDVALAPLARGYRRYVPDAFRIVINNFFENLSDLSTAFNQVLQGKLDLAGSDLLRFGINSTLGFAGLNDIASVFGLEKHREDFGQTLGRWGVPPGPYLVLPLLGPSSVRDGLGLIVDYKTDLTLYMTDDSTTRGSARVLRLVDKRERLLDATRMIDSVALDPYLFVRDTQLQRRRSLVWDGDPPPLPDERN
jgi:phospholipid-binding lipoprotein MlaA